MYTANLTHFCWIKLVRSNFEKIGRVLFYQINLMTKSQSRLKSPRVKKKLRKYNCKSMNMKHLFIHVNNNLRFEILQPEFTTWKYKVKLSAEAATGGVL